MAHGLQVGCKGIPRVERKGILGCWCSGASLQVFQVPWSKEGKDIKLLSSLNLFPHPHNRIADKAPWKTLMWDVLIHLKASCQSQDMMDGGHYLLKAQSGAGGGWLQI